MKVSIDKYALYITSLGCVVFAVFMAIRYMVNVPNADDFGIYLGFLNAMESDVALKKKLEFFFSLQNEHRTFTERLIAFIQFKITGRLNFVYLMLIGNLFWIAAFLILKKVLKIKLESLAFVFLVVLFFNLNQWENMYWATGSLQNFGIIFLMLLSFMLCVGKPKYHWAAILVSGIAFYTSGNGLYVMLLITGYMLVKSGWKQKLFAVLYSGVLIWLYFRFYQSPPYLSSPITNLLYRPWMVLEYFLSYFAGSIYLVGIHDRIFLLITGAFIFILSVGALLRSWRHNPFNFLVLIFCLLSVASASLSRAELGYIQAMTPRYQVINAVLYFIVGYTYLRHVKLNAWARTSICILLIPIYLLTYSQNRKRISDYHYKYVRSAYCHKAERPYNGYVFPIPLIAWVILLESEQRGVYKMPKVKGDYNCLEE